MLVTAQKYYFASLLHIAGNGDKNFILIKGLFHHNNKIYWPIFISANCTSHTL